MIDWYDWAGGREAMMRFGPSAGPVVILALPPFEEANRTRTFAATLLRLLKERGIGGAIPDLPGTGESLVATGDATLAAWRAAYAAAAAHLGRPHSLAVRGGVLLDTDADVAGRWHFAPQNGDMLVRELLRTRAMSDEGKLEIDLADAGDDGPAVALAGNLIARPTLRALNAAKRIEAARTVRLATEAAAADLKVEAVPLWRRAEPDNDEALASRLADDVAGWIA